MPIIGEVAGSQKTVPDAPGIVSATDVGTGRAFNNGAVTVVLSAPTYTGRLPITSYTATPSSGSAASGASTTQTVTGLLSATNYTFTANATNAIGNSPTAGPTGSVFVTTVPAAPGTPTASAGNAQATVSWTAPANGGKAITGYTVTSSPGSITASTTGTSVTVTGLTNGTPYTFTVTATNANGTSTASSASNSVTPVVPAFSYWSIVSGGTQYFKDVATNSTANYYAGALPQVGNQQPSTIFSYSKTASVNWQYSYTPGTDQFLRVESIKLDSSGNIIALAMERNLAGTIYRFSVGSYAPSTGARNWAYNYARSDGLTNVNDVGKLVIDSSGNIYFSGMNGGSPVLVKLDSTGTVLWCTRNFYVTNSGGAYFRPAVSPNYVFELHMETQQIGKDVWTNAVLYRFLPSTGAISGNARRIGGTSSVGEIFIPGSLVADSSDNTYIGGSRFTGSTYNGTVYKANSSLTITNWFQYGVNVTFYGMVRDSSNNIYVAGSSGTICYVLKLDSSLNLQWQRTITPTNGGTLNNPALALDETNNKLLLAAEGNANAWAFAIPTDGSGTGTYTVGSVTMAYAAASVSTSASTITNSSVTVNVTTNQAITRNTVAYTQAATSRTVTTTTF